MSKLKDFESFSDAEIIGEIKNGNIPLFEILIRRNNPYLYKTGRAYGYNHEDVQDLMQDAFVSAYSHLAEFENRSSFRTWLVRIMLNHCYQKNQKASFKNEKPSETIHYKEYTPMFTSKENQNGEKTILAGELGQVLESAIGNIPVDYRLVFSLREINGLSVTETAESLEISEANVKVRLNRAKTMLRKEIEKMYSAEDIYEFNLVYCDMMVNRVMNKINNLEQ